MKGHFHGTAIGRGGWEAVLLCTLRWCHLEPHSVANQQSVLQAHGLRRDSHLQPFSNQWHKGTLEGQRSSCLPHEGPCLTDTRKESLPAETWQHFSTSGMRWPPTMLMPCLVLGRFWLPWESTTFQNSFWSQSCPGQLNFFLGCQISGLPKSDHSSAWPLYRMLWDIL